MVISVNPWVEIGANRLRTGCSSDLWRAPRREARAGLGMDAGDAPDAAADESKTEAGGGSAGVEYHVPVLLDEIVAAIRPAAGHTIFDGTLGGGGHSEAFLRAGASVIACDQDSEAIEHASRRLASFGDRFQAVHANFSAMDSILAGSGVGRVDGILLDLGVSSRHLDAPERGFSFQHDGPLDMRMNPAAPLTAAELVNGAGESELARIFREYGEERASRRIAKAIVKARAERPFSRTGELAGLIASIVPRGGRKHPATRAFQALRIAVNDELGRLAEALAKCADCLKPGGVLAVITFHSLEDRMVKQFLRRHSQRFLDRPEWPAPKPNPEYFFDLPQKKPVAPSVEEQQTNPRSRSAKLRVAVRV